PRSPAARRARRRSTRRRLARAPGRGTGTAAATARRRWARPCRRPAPPRPPATRPAIVGLEPLPLLPLPRATGLTRPRPNVRTAEGRPVREAEPLLRVIRPGTQPPSSRGIAPNRRATRHAPRW